MQYSLKQYLTHINKVSMFGLLKANDGTRGRSSHFYKRYSLICPHSKASIVQIGGFDPLIISSEDGPTTCNQNLQFAFEKINEIQNSGHFIKLRPSFAADTIFVTLIDFSFVEHAEEPALNRCIQSLVKLRYQKQIK